MCDRYVNFFFFLVKRAGRHFGFLKRAGLHQEGAGRHALQKRPRQNTALGVKLAPETSDRAVSFRQVTMIINIAHINIGCSVLS